SARDHVGAAAGGERHDDADGPVGIALRERRARARKTQRREAQGGQRRAPARRNPPASHGHGRPSTVRSEQDILVSRFRRSYHLAARTFTNVGTKGTLAAL